MTRTRSALISALAAAVSVGAAFLLTLAFDWMAGMYLYSSHRNAGLIFGPYSEVHHTTREFSYVARINNLGFRDRDFSAGRSSKKRAIALGDSFTYGWGVDIADSWPKALERDLNAAGVPIEVLNLGSPGASPRQYADLAEKAVPLLRPDIVIVGVVQADDLHQLREKAPPVRMGWRARMRRTLAERYPYLTQWIGGTDVKKLNVSGEELAAIWKKQVQDFTARMEPAERKKFEGLEPAIRTAYQEGGLNPGLLFYSIRHSSFMLDACDIEAPAIRAEIDEMTAELRRIVGVAGRWGAAAVVVSIPYGPYASEDELKTVGRLGFAVRPDMLTSEAPEQSIERACRGAGLPFVSVMREFRRRARSGNLYFPLDGHLNAAGHRTYAELAAPALRARIR